jgi:hypothetical protein
MGSQRSTFRGNLTVTGLKFQKRKRLRGSLWRSRLTVLRRVKHPFLTVTCAPETLGARGFPTDSSGVDQFGARRSENDLVKGLRHYNPDLVLP